MEVAGDPLHPITRGTLCTKVARYLERTYSDQRVLHPLRRVGPKGEGKFERITWDEALDSHRRAVQGDRCVADGPQAILPYSYAGTMGMLQYGSMDRRFFHKLGASLLDRTICSSAGKAGYKATIGAAIGIDLEQFEDAKLILIWGSNPDRLQPASLEPRAGGEAPRREAGRHRSVPQPDRGEVPRAPRACCRAPTRALALGMMHVLIAEDLLDHDYIDQLHARASSSSRSASKSTHRACRRDHRACRPKTIVALARDYGTIRPAAIRLNYGMQRHAGGGMAVRTIACLPALVGAWRDPAGGHLLSTSGTYPVDHAKRSSGPI